MNDDNWTIETEEEARKWIELCKFCLHKGNCQNWKKVREFGKRNKKYTFEQVFGFACIAQKQEKEKIEKK